MLFGERRCSLQSVSLISLIQLPSVYFIIWYNAAFRLKLMLFDLVISWWLRFTLFFSERENGLIPKSIFYQTNPSLIQLLRNLIWKIKVKFTAELNVLREVGGFKIWNSVSFQIPSPAEKESKRVIAVAAQLKAASKIN